MLALLLLPFALQAQMDVTFSMDADKVAQRVASYKKEARGPYKDIRWFCDDGTVNAPKEPCEEGGVQHARNFTIGNLLSAFRQ